MKNQVLTIEQMRELQELGIDVSKASMCYLVIKDHLVGEESTYLVELDSFLTTYLYENHNISIKEKKYTFTLYDILDMLPKNIMHSNKQLKTCNYKLCTFDNKVMYTFNSFEQCWLKCTHGKNLLEAAFNMLKWCKQNNFI